MLEAGVLVNVDTNEVIDWNLPGGRSSVCLPHSRSHWEAIWNNRHLHLGFAHTHPGSGVPAPSHEDITTFDAIERGIGKPLIWWILTQDSMIQVVVNRADLSYVSAKVKGDAELPDWVRQLRQVSYERENDHD
jgi:hypothetical protein